MPWSLSSQGILTVSRSSNFLADGRNLVFPQYLYGTSHRWENWTRSCTRKSLHHAKVRDHHRYWWYDCIHRCYSKYKLVSVLFIFIRHLSPLGTLLHKLATSMETQRKRLWPRKILQNCSWFFPKKEACPVVSGYYRLVESVCILYFAFHHLYHHLVSLSQNSLIHSFCAATLTGFHHFGRCVLPLFMASDVRKFISSLLLTCAPSTRTLYWFRF